jgi:hypothetical protein
MKTWAWTPKDLSTQAVLESEVGTKQVEEEAAK